MNQKQTHRPTNLLLVSVQITDSQADTLEYEVAQALQELITKNAKDNEIEEPDISMDYPISRGDDMDAAPEDNMVGTEELSWSQRRGRLGL